MQQPVSFKELKSRVGVDDIAFSLGYRIDKKAGVGRYMELVLGDPNNPSDKIVVKNSPDKSQQFYFRRDGSKGDVVGFIKENLNSFAVSGSNDWIKVLNVLIKHSNLPISINEDKSYIASKSNTQKTFDPTRYNVFKIKSEKTPYILRMRGFSEDCVKAMGDNVLFIQDLRNKNYDGYNIGFPYINPANSQLCGYEIRGNNGFKSKAAGTDSAHSAWIAEFPKDSPKSIRDVYFFESSFDAMAFYQINKVKISSRPFALVSVGGSFNPQLSEDIMKRFPSARAWDCFDNDLAGQQYSANLVKTIDKADFEIETTENNINIKHGDTRLQCPKEGFSFQQAAIDLGINYSTGHWKSPRNYKDWNDCLLGNKIEPELSTSKYKRDENLAKQRQSKQKF